MDITMSDNSHEDSINNSDTGDTVQSNSSSQTEEEIKAYWDAQTPNEISPIPLPTIDPQTKRRKEEIKPKNETQLSGNQGSTIHSASSSITKKKDSQEISDPVAPEE